MAITDSRVYIYRWLIIKGHDEKALRSLARLHAKGDESDPFVLGEFAAIKNKVEAEAVMQQSWRLVSLSWPCGA